MSMSTQKVTYFYTDTRLIKMQDPATERPLFTVRSIELACEKCKLAGKAQSCVHLLHLVPRWHSEERHRKLKIMMQDRPDLLLSEMQGCSFDALEQVFPKMSINLMMDLKALPSDFNTKVFIVVDPAAGGPSSDYAIVSIVRTRGTVTVCLFVCLFVFMLVRMFPHTYLRTYREKSSCLKTP